ncbi:hypothetical protein PAMP_006043 [Pampus punctatissimus]
MESKEVKAGLETLQRRRKQQQRRGCGHREACTLFSVQRNDEVGIKTRVCSLE